MEAFCLFGTQLRWSFGMRQNICSELQLIKEANFSLVALCSTVKLKSNSVMTGRG